MYLLIKQNYINEDSHQENSFKVTGSDFLYLFFVTMTSM